MTMATHIKENKVTPHTPFGAIFFQTFTSTNTMSEACPLQQTVNHNFDSNYFTNTMSFKPPVWLYRDK